MTSYILFAGAVILLCLALNRISDKIGIFGVYYSYTF